MGVGLQGRNPSELKSRLECDHSKGAVATLSSPVGGEVGSLNAPTPVCVPGFPGIPAYLQNRQAEIWMIEQVEELAVAAQFHSL